jgi:hypothetical protein
MLTPRRDLQHVRRIGEQPGQFLGHPLTIGQGLAFRVGGIGCVDHRQCLLQPI